MKFDMYRRAYPFRHCVELQFCIHQGLHRLLGTTSYRLTLEKTNDEIKPITLSQNGVTGTNALTVG